MSWHSQATTLNWPTQRNFNFFFNSVILYSNLNQFQYGVQEDIITLLHKIYIENIVNPELEIIWGEWTEPRFCTLLAGGRGENQFISSYS